MIVPIVAAIIILTHIASETTTGNQIYFGASSSGTLQRENHGAMSAEWFLAITFFKFGIALRFMSFIAVEMRISSRFRVFMIAGDGQE